MLTVLLSVFECDWLARLSVCVRGSNWLEVFVLEVLKIVTMTTEDSRLNWLADGPLLTNVALSYLFLLSGFFEVFVVLHWCLEAPNGCWEM